MDSRDFEFVDKLDQILERVVAGLDRDFHNSDEVIRLLKDLQSTVETLANQPAKNELVIPQGDRKEDIAACVVDALAKRLAEDYADTQPPADQPQTNPTKHLDQILRETYEINTTVQKIAGWIKPEKFELLSYIPSPPPRYRFILGVILMAVIDRGISYLLPYSGQWWVWWVDPIGMFFPPKQ